MPYFPVWTGKQEGMAIRSHQIESVEVILALVDDIVFYPFVKRDFGKWNHIFIYRRHRRLVVILCQRRVIATELQLHCSEDQMATLSDFHRKDVDKDCLTPQTGVFWDG